MEPRTLGEVYDELPNVFDRAVMLSEEEGERDERETDYKDEQLMSEEVRNETVYVLALEQQPSDVDKVESIIPNKLETSEDQCAARHIYNLETANSFKLQNKSEKLRELSEESHFIAETNGAKAKHYSTEFDSILRRRAVVVLERCAIFPSPTTPTQYFKIENETDDENSLGDAANNLKLENKSENQRESEKRNFMFENFEISNFTEFDRIFQRKSIVVLERCILPSASSDAPMKDCKYEEAIQRQTLEQHEKQIVRLNEGFIEKETPEQYKECLADAAERQRKAIERETPEQREIRIVRLQNEKYKQFLAKETPEQYKKRVAAVAERQRKARQKETPEQREKRLAAYNAYKRKWVKNRMLKQSEKYIAAEDSENSFSAETQGEKHKKVIETDGECRQVVVTREREMCASQQHVNETGIKNEGIVEDEIEIIFDSYSTNVKTKSGRESAKQREKHPATPANNYYRRFMVEEMPDQHNQCLVASTETCIEARDKELLELWEKRRAKLAERNRKQREKETPEQRKKRLAYMVEYKKKVKDRETYQQLEARGLSDAERRKRVEPTDINTNGLSPHDDVNQLYQYCMQLQLPQPIWTDDVSGQAKEAAQNGHLTDALAAQKFVNIPKATNIAAIKYNKRRSNLLDCLFGRTRIPSVAASSSSRMKNESTEERRVRLAAAAERKRKAQQRETPEQRKKRLMSHVEYRRKRKETETPEQRKKRLAACYGYQRKWRENRMLEQGEKCLGAEDGLSPQVCNDDNNTEHFSSKPTSEQMAAEIAAYQHIKAPILLSYLLGHQSIGTTIRTVAASSSTEDGLSLQERNKTLEELKKAFLAKRVEYMRKRREKKKQEQFEKRLAAYNKYKRKWMEKEMHEQCQNCPTTDVVNEKVGFSSQHFNENVIKSSDEARKCGQVEIIGTREVCSQQVRCANAESTRETIVIGKHDKHLLTPTENYGMFTVEEMPERSHQCLAASAETCIKTREKELQEQRKKRYEYLRKRIENETPEQRKKRLASKAKSKKKAKERETPKERKERLAKQAEYTRRYLEKRMLKQDKEHLATALERWIKWMENETPEQREKYLTAMTERIRQEVKEREMFQQLEKVAKISKKLITVEPIDSHENGLSPSDDNENNNVSTMKSSDPIAADEVDFSFEHVIENAMKSEPAVFDIVEDDVEIIYESNVTDTKTKIKSEAIDQSKKRLAVRAEKKNPEQREKHLAAMGKYNEISKRHKKHLAAITEMAMEKETPEQRKKCLAKQYEYTRKWLENRMLKRGKEYLADATERWLKCMENETPEQREKYLADMTERIRQELKEREMFKQLEKEHIDVAEISKKVIKTEPIDDGRENELSSQADNENMKSDPFDADEVGFSSQDVKQSNVIVKNEVVNENEAVGFSSQHVNENAVKSEAAAFAVEDAEDELEIDFEAYFEAGMNNSPIDENKLNFFFLDDRTGIIRIKSENVNEELVSSDDVRENNIAIKSEAVISEVEDKDEVDFEGFLQR